MSAFLPIVLTAVTWTPDRMKGDVFFYSDHSVERIDLRRTLSISLVAPSKTSKLYKVRFKMMTPVEDSVTTLIDYSVTVDCTFIIPAKANLADRENIKADFLEFLLGANEVNNTVEDLAPMF